ncbi:hypothetical protein B0H11DRAFT_2398550 [Mycena galericulata]|nr:hypothetical protein B0H11DRAFT_2398550 [Mycena galericulata]
MIAAIHLVAHILFVLALVASAAGLIHTNDTSYFCGSHWPSHEHGLTPSHTCLPAAGVLSLIVVLSARALRRAVSTSFWSPPRGVSFSTASNSARAFRPPSKFATSEPTNFPPPISQPSSPPPYIHPLSSPTSPPPSPSTNFTDYAFSKRSIHASNPIWPMPARNDRIAPVFNSNKPRELRKYFSDLEFLLARSRIADRTEMKCHATRFLDIDEQDLWESVPEFRDPAASFNSFTCAIFRLYPEADPERRYSVADLNNVVAEISPVQPLSRPRFLEFYRRFYRISTFLRSKDRLSAPEESRIFRRAIPPNIWELVQHRLHIKFPDTYPDDSYTLLDMRDAVDFVLIEKIFRSPPTLSTPELPHHSSELRAPEAVSTQTPIAVLADAVKQLTQCVPSQKPSHVVLDPDLEPLSPYPVASHPASPFAPSRTTTCSYCSDPTHFIAQCPLVTADIRAGTCRRNAEGKVVLPSGRFVPHRITGRDLRTRICSWHTENSTRSAPVSHPRDITFASCVPPHASYSPRSASEFVALHVSAKSPAVPAPTFNAQIPPSPLRACVSRQPAPTSDTFTRDDPDIPSCASNSPMQFGASFLPSTRSCHNNLVAVL